jgi:Tfp pilus assembly protein PilV
MRRLRTDERGISLIEVLVAILVLTAGLLAVLTGLVDSSKATQTTQRQSTAYTVGSQQIEKLRELSPKIDLESFTALHTALASIENVVNSAQLNNALQDVNSTLNALVGLNLVQVLADLNGAIGSALSNDTNVINSATTGINNTMAALKNDVGSPDSLQNISQQALTNVQTLSQWLLTNPNGTVQQTKRITVAVTFADADALTKPTNVGIRTPVWLSTLATDPTDGTL